MTHAHASAAPTGRPEGESLEQIRKWFVQLWLDGSLPPLERMLKGVAPAERDRALAELVLDELELRLNADEDASIAEYLARFPSLAKRKDLLRPILELERSRRPKRSRSPITSAWLTTNGGSWSSWPVRRSRWPWGPWSSLGWPSTGW